LVEHQALTVAGSHCSKHAVTTARKIAPPSRLHDGFHIADSLDLVGVAERAVEAQRRAPRVEHQNHIMMQTETPEARVPNTHMVDEPIRLCRRWCRLPHAYEIGGEAATAVADVRDDVPPKKRPRRIAMEKDNRRPHADVNVAHLGINHTDSLPRMVIDRSHLQVSLPRRHSGETMSPMASCSASM